MDKARATPSTAGARSTRQDKLARLRALLGQGAQLVPATAAQERFWVLEHAGDDGWMYHVSEAVDIVGPLDESVLKQCLEQLIARHEALRTAVMTVRDRPTQLILPHVPAPLHRLDLRPGQSIEECLRNGARRPFALAKAPLWRLVLVPVSPERPERYAAMAVFHHLIADGWSIAVFLQEILHCYAAEIKGTLAHLPPALPYRAYEAERRQYLTPERVENQVAYWRERLHNPPAPLALPVDAAQSAADAPAGAWLTFDLGVQGESNARQLAQAGKTTLFGVFAAVFHAMLYTFSGERDLLVGTVVSGRHGRRAWETVLGPLINSLVLRTSIEPKEAFGTFLRRCREDFLHMLEHQDLPFERIAQLAQSPYLNNVPRTPGQTPLTNVGIVYHEYPMGTIQDLPFTVRPLPFDTGRAQMDLSLVITNEDGRMHCRFEYNTRVLREETVRTIRNVFLAILSAAVADPTRALKDVCSTAFPELVPMHLTQHMRQIWQGEQVFADPLLYRNTVLYKIPKALDVEVFLRAADFVVDRTDGLRVQIDNNGGYPRLRFPERQPDINRFCDVSAADDPGEACNAWLEGRLHRASELARAPFRTDLVKLGPEHYIWHISHHHMFSDGRSVMILVERVSDIYRQMMQGHFDPARIRYPQMAQQLIDDVAYQRSTRFRRDAAYWQKRLQGTGAPLSFYGREPRKSGTTIDRVPHKIGPARSVRLRAMAQQGMTTVKGLDAFLCNVFGVILAVYLHKVSGGTKRIVFGSVNHNRRNGPSKDIIGLYMQVIPHVIEVEDDDTFRSLMGKMDREMRASLRHGLYAVESSMSRPHYDVLLNYHKETPVHFDDVQAGYEVIVRRATQSFGVNITNYDLSGDLELQFDFHRDVFAALTYPRAMAHFLSVVDALIDNPDTSITSVCLLTPEERQRILIDFNDTEVALPLDKDLYTVFADTAAERADDICASDAHGTIRYRELLQSSQALCRRLIAAGISGDSVVPILAERGIPFLEAILAIFRMGAAYLPLDPAAPPNRLAHIIGACGAQAVLVQPALGHRLPDDIAARQLSLPEGPQLRPTDGGADSVSDEPAHGPMHNRDTARMAYVIYTSGSTGRPKGAMVAQRGMMNHIYSKIRDLEIDDGDVIVQNASQCFDISIWQFLTALVCGARTVILADSTVLEPDTFTSTLEKEGATVLEVVPSYLRVLLDHWDRQPERVVLPTLRCLVVTGEALPADLVRRWMERRPEVPMVNAYGPTECSDDVAHHVLRAAPGPGESNIPIGKPIVNTQLYVLDDGLQPVPAGTEGQLYVGGDGVGLGYLGDEEKTRHAFIANPLPEGRSPLLYRTGDRASWRADGCLAFHGRLDHQVKLRGYRIELAEIEVALCSHPGVANAVVMLRQVRDSDALVAYVVTAAKAPASQSDLRDLIADQLPSYMIPEHWLFIDRIPLTANGKTDRAALPDPVLASALPARAETEPMSARERDLADIWAAILQQPTNAIAAESDFFALGGDSLRAIQMLSLAASRGMELGMKEFLYRPTLRAMAENLRPLSTMLNQPVTSAPDTAAPQPVRDALGDVPFTAAQRHFLRFFSNDNEADTAAITEYARTPPANPNHDNVAMWLSLDASLAVHAQAAFTAVCTEHDVFRLDISRTPSGWTQRLNAEAKPPAFFREQMPHTDRATGPDEAQLLAWADRAQRALDLQRGTLAAGLLVEDAVPGRVLFLAVLHHFVADAVSARLLLQQFAVQLVDRKGLSGTREPAQPRPHTNSGNTSTQAILPHSTGFTGYARALQRAADDGAFDEQLEYWHAQGPQRAAPLVNDTAPPENLVADQRSMSEHISLRNLRASEIQNAGPGNVDHAALSALTYALSCWRGPAAYAIGIVDTGREWSPPGLNIERTVGWFNSYYPVIFDVTGNQTPADIAAIVHARLQKVPNGGVGYGVLRYMHPNPAVRNALDSLGDPPIMFNYLGQLSSTSGDLSLARRYSGATGATRAPGNRRLAWIHAECWIEIQSGNQSGGQSGDRSGDQRMVLRLDYHRRAFAETDIAQLLQHWYEGLRAVIELQTAQARTGA